MKDNVRTLLKRVSIAVFTLLFAIGLFGCSQPAANETGAQAESAQEESAQAESAQAESVQEESAQEETAEPVPETGALWQYRFAGLEHPYLSAISDYLCRYNAEHLELADGMIPCITAIEVDNEDEHDIKMWGIFDIYNYSLEGDTLVEKNGERLMGCFHLNQAEDGSCTVTDTEFIEAEDQTAIDELCKDHEMALDGLSNPTVTEETRRQYISDLVKAENLDAVKYQPEGQEAMPIAYSSMPSPAWVAELPEAAETNVLFVVETTIGSNAIFTMHEKDADGNWTQTLDDAAFIGKNGTGKTREGDLKTPLGTFGFNQALGILDDPGCAFEYTKVNDTHYWDADVKSEHYNSLVSTDDYTDFNKDDSEHIVDYPNAYKYILNTTYNEERTPDVGSAIFLHCYREARTYTGGCISIPFESMEYVMKTVQPDSLIVIREQ